MTVLSILAYIADAAILGTYAWSARWPRRVKWFHQANALGGATLVVYEVSAHAWPIVPLHSTFAVVGAYGWLMEKRDGR